MGISCGEVVRGGHQGGFGCLLNFGPTATAISEGVEETDRHRSLTIFTVRRRREESQAGRRSISSHSRFPSTCRASAGYYSSSPMPAKPFSHRPLHPSSFSFFPHLTPQLIHHLTGSSIDHVESRKADVSWNVSHGRRHCLLCAFPAEGREGCKLINS